MDMNVETARQGTDAIARCGTQAGPAITVAIVTAPVWVPYAYAVTIGAGAVSFGAGYYVGYNYVADYLFPDPAAGPPACGSGEPSGCPLEAAKIIPFTRTTESLITRVTRSVATARSK